MTPLYQNDPSGGILRGLPRGLPRVPRTSKEGTQEYQFGTLEYQFGTLEYDAGTSPSHRHSLSRTPPGGTLEGCPRGPSEGDLGGCPRGPSKIKSGRPFRNRCEFVLIWYSFSVILPLEPPDAFWALFLWHSGKNLRGNPPGTNSGCVLGGCPGL